MLFITDIELLSNYCRELIAREYPQVRYPSNCYPLYHAVVGDIDGLRAHFKNAENIDKQLNKNER